MREWWAGGESVRALAFVLFSTLLFAIPAFAEPLFMGLGFLPGDDGSEANGVSGDSDSLTNC